MKLQWLGRREPEMEDSNVGILRRRRGRPKGAKDTEPRLRTAPVPVAASVNAAIADVPTKIRALTGPVRPAVAASLIGYSEATIRRRVKEGSLPAFVSLGNILIDPAALLEYWQNRLSYSERFMALYRRGAKKF